MFAVNLEDAKTIAIALTAVFAVGAIISFWVMRTIVQKLAVAVLLGALSFAVWTQRVALQDCADKVTAGFERAGTDVTLADTDCSFFGVTITISDPRSDDATSARR